MKSPCVKMIHTQGLRFISKALIKVQSSFSEVIIIDNTIPKQLTPRHLLNKVALLLCKSN